MRKKVLALVTMMLCATMLSACGGNGEKTKEITKVDDLEGSKIGVQLGTTGDIYASDYEGDDAGTIIERYNKCTDAVQALRQGKIDCVIVDEQPAIESTKDEKNLKILDEEFALEEYAICISKDNEELLGKVNTALANLKDSGKLDEIVAKYIKAE